MDLDIRPHTERNAFNCPKWRWRPRVGWRAAKSEQTRRPVTTAKFRIPAKYFGRRQIAIDVSRWHMIAGRPMTTNPECADLFKWISLQQKHYRRHIHTIPSYQQPAPSHFIVIEVRSLRYSCYCCRLQSKHENVSHKNVENIYVQKK